jgi:predicted DsbA family dithiol-disulfide isomerase
MCGRRPPARPSRWSRPLSEISGSPEPGDNRLPATPDTIVVYSDLHCSFAHLAVHRLHEARRRLGLEDVLRFDHRAFALELFNHRVNSLRGVNSEVSVVGALQPDAGWQLWQAPDWFFPVTTLPAMEAVQAAKTQGWRASEQLDVGLRRAFWAESRCISMRHVILDVASRCDGLDLHQLTTVLDSGQARASLFEQFSQSSGGRVNCSPHVFLFDGTNSANPGVSVRWVNGAFGVGFPVIDSDDPSVYDTLLEHAAKLAANRSADGDPLPAG